MSKRNSENPAPCSPGTAARLYESLLRIRRVEEEIARIYWSDKIKSPVHLSIGQEAVSVGVCDVVRGNDIVSPTYRGHAAYLAKGGDLRGMIAELFGKASGCAAGKGGSMHLIDADRQVVGTSAVVGTTIPVAVGHALAHRGTDRAVIAFFGDGATEEGVFYESVNFAALFKLSVLFVCENNFFAIHTGQERRWANNDLCGRVKAFGLPAHKIDSGDIFEIRDRANDCLTKLRAGEGPQFMECMTYRWKEHVGPEEDFDAGYRSHEEIRPWMEADQVVRLATIIDPETRQRVETKIEAEIKDAFEFAENDRFPGAEELKTHVFAD